MSLCDKNTAEFILISHKMKYHTDIKFFLPFFSFSLFQKTVQPLILCLNVNQPAFDKTEKSYFCQKFFWFSADQLTQIGMDLSRADISFWLFPPFASPIKDWTRSSLLSIQIRKHCSVFACPLPWCCINDQRSIQGVNTERVWSRSQRSFSPSKQTLNSSKAVP